MLSYACINYLRHNVPQHIAGSCNNVLRNATEAPIYRIHNNYNFSQSILVENEDFGNFYLNIYQNLFNIINNLNYDYFFLTEGDVEYSIDHFTKGLDTILEFPNKIACNKNLIQKINHSYRRNAEYVRPLSSLSGSKETLLKEIQKKIDEYNQYGNVTWLEPGYDRDGSCSCIDYKSDNAIYEIRHEHSSTAISSWEVRPQTNSKIQPVKKNINKKNNYKVALLGILSTFEPMYSVTTCVVDYINLLARHTETFVLIVPSDFQEEYNLPSNVELRRISRYFGDPIQDERQKFDSFVEKCTEELFEALRDVNICLEHDGIFLESFLPYNACIRNVISMREDLKWIHWIHSAPNSDPTNTNYPQNLLKAPLNNSTLISINKTNMPVLAKMYSMQIENVVFIPNMIDPVKSLNFHALTKEIYYHKKLWEQDIICTYPARTVDAKQAHKIIKLLAACKRQGQKVKFLYCNSYANAENEMNFLKSLEELSIELDFEEDFFATSTFLSDWGLDNGHNISLGVPHQVTLDLSKISDIFILPSVSEGCSLIMLEAALNKNFIILNDDLDTLFDFGGEKYDEYSSDKAFYINFGSIKKPFTSYIPDETSWYDEKAKQLIAVMSQQKNLNFFKSIRKEHAPEYIWSDFLEPLLRINK